MASPTLDEVLASMERDRERIAAEQSDLAAKLAEKEDEVSGLDRAIAEIRKRAKLSEPGRLSGLTKFEAAKKVLTESGRPMGTAEIVDAVLAGGYHTESQRSNFYNAVYTLLRAKAEDPEKHGIRKSGKRWTLTGPEGIS